MRISRRRSRSHMARPSFHWEYSQPFAMHPTGKMSPAAIYAASCSLIAPNVVSIGCVRLGGSFPITPWTSSSKAILPAIGNPPRVGDMTSRRIPHKHFPLATSSVGLLDTKRTHRAHRNRYLDILDPLCNIFQFTGNRLGNESDTLSLGAARGPPSRTRPYV